MYFKVEVKPTHVRSLWSILRLIFNTAVHNVRKSHANPLIGLIVSMVQTVMMVVGFYLMYYFTGTRSSAIRGDFILFIFSGIFMYMLHSKAMGAVMKADGPISSMMLHAPMNTLIAMMGGALAALYLQLLSLFVVLYFYHAIMTPITINEPPAVLGMMLLSWASGAAIGMLFRAAMPWHPRLIGIISGVYMRLTIVTSGKMFVANSLSTMVLSMFDWNPLFHTIDQGRGFIFVNYNPHYSSISYAVYVTLVCVVIGLMGEFYTRQHISASWTAGK